jgi:small-conductance mechanosensitive channel
MNNFLEWLAKFFGHIDVSGIEALGIKGLHALIVLLVVFGVSRMLQRTIDRRMSQETHDDKETISTYKYVARFIVWAPGLLIALHVAGINLSSLFTTGGLFALALAFAMKNIAENFISGVILRIERTIKVGDVLESEGDMVRVKKIGFRATIVRSKDEKDLLVPNAQLLQERVANFTYSDSVCRVETTVGVAYSSDLKKVQEVLKRVCANLDGKSDKHQPQILLAEFGDSSVNFKIRIWIENPWDARQRQASLNEAIWWGLKEAGIVIAFPQLDVHFDKTSENPSGPGL